LAGPLPILFGPTAVGKTELVDKLAESLPGLEIVNADSMQVYRRLDIGTAKPSAALRRRIPHHLIDIVDPEVQFDAGQFVRRAERAVEEIRARGGLPLLCGGSAYYLRSFLCGLAQAPASDPGLRLRLKEELSRRGLGALLEELGRVDPASRAAVAEGDAYRVLRALEVYRACGRPLSSFVNPDRPREDHRFLVLGLQRERPELYRRIDARVEGMFAAGLRQEVAGLLACGYGPADPGLRGIGYREFFLMQRGCWTQAELREAIQRNSRRFAKRQITFFKSLPGVEWLPAGEPQQVARRIQGFLATASATRSAS
jgi:tRNA dimethylallyltransferase